MEDLEGFGWFWNILDGFVNEKILQNIDNPKSCNEYNVNVFDVLWSLYKDFGWIWSIL